MKHGDDVSCFEREFAAMVGAKFAIAASNGTVTLQAALVALGVKPGDRVATTPLTMSATTIAILNVGGVPLFCDVDPETWLMASGFHEGKAVLPVSLYGLHARAAGLSVVVDGAQTLQPHRWRPWVLWLDGCPGFTSYSLQRSKILSTGEGGVLCTNDEALAERARSYLSLGYKMGATQSRIDSAAIRANDYPRHHLPMSINGRMNDLTAREGLRLLPEVPLLKAVRRECAALYAEAVAGCGWLTPQAVPVGWAHSWWAYAVACDTPERARWLQVRVAEHGGERPYGAWALTFNEPAFKYLDPGPDACPVARRLQPCLLQWQTNHLPSAERNAAALRRAIEEVG